MTEHRKIGEQLHQMADEIRVKLHLAGMDAKDAWTKLEPRLHEYEKKAESATDKVAEELHRFGQELKEEMSKFLGQLKKD